MKILHFRKTLLGACCAALLLSPVALSAHALAPTRAAQQAAGKRISTPDETLSLVLGSDWDVQSDNGYFSARNENERMILIASNSYVGEASDLAEFITGLKGNWKLKTLSESKPRTVKLGKAGDAQRVDISATDNGNKQLVRVIALNRNGRLYPLIAIGSAAAEKPNDKTLQAVLETIEISNKIFGLERDQLIAFAGGRVTAEFMDPAIYTGSAEGYPGMLFSGLVRLTPQLQVEGDLAESWKVSADGKTYTFALRKNSAFADGKAITSADVIYTWERAASPKTKSSTAGTYLGDIDGVKDMLAGKAKTIRGLKAIDASTLQVTLDSPKPYFLAKLTYPTSFVVDQRDVKKDAKNWMLKPNASGPYKIKRYDEDQVIIFERNPKYHVAAKVPNVVYYIQPGGSYLSLYQAGQLDVVGVSREDFKLISDPAHPQNKDLRAVQSMCSSMLMIDSAQAPLDDIDVRRAVAQAIDWDALAKINEVEYDTEAWNVLPAPLPGARERERTLTFDPAAAKAAIQRSKYAGKLPKIIVTLRGDGTTESAFYTAFVGMLRKNLGATVEVDYVESDTFAREVRKKHGQIVPYGWCADYPDPENFLDVLFHSASDFNVATFKDAKFDSLIEKARTEQDVAKRLALYGDAEQRLYDEVLTIPFPTSESHMLVQPYIKDYVPVSIGVQQTFRLSIKR
jgi:oligopeptide transport system substrate-binding protein